MKKNIKKFVVEEIDNLIKTHPKLLTFQKEYEFYFGDFTLISQIIEKKLHELNSKIESTPDNGIIKAKINSALEKAIIMSRQSINDKFDNQSEKVRAIHKTFDDFFIAKNNLKK